MAMVSGVAKDKHMVRIELEGSPWLQLPQRHFAKFPLREGEDIDPQAYIAALADIQAQDCYESALTLLDRSSCSARELQAKLVRKGYVAPAAEATVEKLREIRLIDDQRYAERLAQLQQSKPVGAAAVRRKLRAKQLSEEDIDAAMAGFDAEQQHDACRAAAEKLWRKYGQLPPREGRVKLTQALARRGFSWEVIRETVQELPSGEEPRE